MILGTGIDIVEVERIAEKLAKENGFIHMVFSAEEITYCQSKTNSAEHFSARFAAKEAFLKAIGKGLTAGFDLFNIVIQTESSGKPLLILRGSFAELARSRDIKMLHVSMSHTKTMACATVILEG